jgi:hypothetical protein
VAAKVGQMASYVDGIVPEGQREADEIAAKIARSGSDRNSRGDAPLGSLTAKTQQLPPPLEPGTKVTKQY